MKVAATPLLPIQPLAEPEIVDRPLRNVRALTDGERPYRIAAWMPGGPFVAVVPQDGPGMDLVDVESGTVVSVVTDTYVLEPNWTDTGKLLIHQVEGDRDTITVYDPEEGFAAMPLAAGPRLSAPAYAGDLLAFSRDEGLLLCQSACDAPRLVSDTAALVTALGPGGRMLAWNPRVADLQSVQTLVMRVGELEGGAIVSEALPASAPGEGLWLPRWSPDGTRLALTSVEGRIAVVAVDGSRRQDLGPGDTPAWSPDGRWIAYAGASAGLEYTTRDLHLVAADGSGGRLRLTDAGEEQLFVSPTWSPDGPRLAFVELDSGQLFVGDVPVP